MLGVTFGSKHSYNDWGIWLEDTHINPPLPKRYIVDVPARNGLLDLTPELTPTIRFENRTLTFNFRVKAGDWSTLVSQIYGDIHGRTLDVVSDLDPNWHWHGCVTVDDFSSDQRTGKLVITVDADPFKLSNTESSYTVNGNGTITCVVDRMEISPAFELTAPTTVIYGDSSYVLENTATTEKTLSGDIVSFADGTANPAVDLTVDIEALQSGSGDPSPTNIRPISGWDEVNVNAVGKNLLDVSNTTSASSAHVHAYNLNLDAGTYTISATCVSTADTDCLCLFIYEDGTTSPLKTLRNNNWSKLTINATKRIAELRIYASTGYSISQNYTVNVTYAQLEFGSTATAYEPYNGNTYTIDLNGTRYGGTLDVTTGVLTVTKFQYAFSGNETFLSNSAWGDYAFLYNTGVSLVSSVDAKRHNICSHLVLNEQGAWTTLTPNHFMVAGGSYIGLGYDGTQEQLKAWLSAENSNGTPVQVIGLLATPQVVQLTAEHVMILKNQNNIWADSGEVEVTYLAQDFAGKKFYIPDLELTEGSNTLTIQGTGTTTVTYTNGRL